MPLLVTLLLDGSPLGECRATSSMEFNMKIGRTFLSAAVCCAPLVAANAQTVSTCVATDGSENSRENVQMVSTGVFGDGSLRIEAIILEAKALSYADKYEKVSEVYNDCHTEAFGQISAATSRPRSMEAVCGGMISRVSHQMFEGITRYEVKGITIFTTNGERFLIKERANYIFLKDGEIFAPAGSDSEEATYICS